MMKRVVAVAFVGVMAILVAGASCSAAVELTAEQAQGMRGGCSTCTCQSWDCPGFAVSCDGVPCDPNAGHPTKEHPTGDCSPTVQKETVNRVLSTTGGDKTDLGRYPCGAALECWCLGLPGAQHFCYTKAIELPQPGSYNLCSDQ